MTPKEQEDLFLKQMAILREMCPEWAAQVDAEGEKLSKIGKALAEAMDKWVSDQLVTWGEPGGLDVGDGG